MSNEETPETHSIVVGYGLWLLGFTGAHRFYYGKPLTGLLWLLTFGLLLIGWVLDFFLIPSMNEDARRKYQYGPTDYTVTWILFGVFGWLGIHRFYMRKWFTGILYALTVGLGGIGLIYDLFTLNAQINEINVRDTLHTFDE